MEGNGITEDPKIDVFGLICGVVEREMNVGDKESVEDGEKVEMVETAGEILDTAVVVLVELSVAGLRTSPGFTLDDPCGFVGVFAVVLTVLS